MNKPELEKEVKLLTKEVEKLKRDNSFLFKEQKKYVKMAQDAGTELAPYKAMVIRLREEMSRTDTLLKKNR